MECSPRALTSSLTEIVVISAYCPVHPGKQRSGIGARMMQEAEDLGRRAGCRFADIRTVSVRPELSVIYQKLGYIETGVESAAVIKSATMPVHFVTMSKPL